MSGDCTSCRSLASYDPLYMRRRIYSIYARFDFPSCGIACYGRGAGRDGPAGERRFKRACSARKSITGIKMHGCRLCRFPSSGKDRLHIGGHRGAIRLKRAYPFRIGRRETAPWARFCRRPLPGRRDPFGQAPLQKGLRRKLWRCLPLSLLVKMPTALPADRSRSYHKIRNHRPSRHFWRPPPLCAQPLVPA